MVRARSAKPSRPWFRLGAIALALLTSCSSAADRLAPDGGTGGDPTEGAPGDLALVDRSDGAVLQIAMARPDSWLPAEADLGEPEAVLLADLLYDGLTEASLADGTLRPALASSWSASQDLSTWRFTIDTERSDPATVVASFDALLDADASSVAITMLEHVESVEIDGDDVVFDLGRPDAGLPGLLSGVAYSVVGADPSGRFDVVETETGLRLRLRPGLSAVVEQVDVDFTAEAADARQALVDGGADVAVVDADGLLGALEAMGQSPVPSVVTSFWALNTRSAAMSQLWLRRAVLDALDVEAMRAALPPSALHADGVVGPGTVGYAADACGEACGGASASAEAALASAEEPVAIVIGYSGVDRSALAELAGAQLDAVGFVVAIRRLEPLELAEAVADGEVDLFLAGWAAPATSIDAVVSPLFAAGSSTNLVGATSQAVESLLAQASTEVEDARRWELLAAAQELMLAESIAVPLAVAPVRVVHSTTAAVVRVRADGTLDLG